MSNPVISRNDVTKELSEQVFGKKSDNAGKKFFAPVLSLSDWDNDVLWLGKDTMIGGMNKILRNIFAGIYLDNLDPITGVLNEESWAAEAADFTAGVAKLSDLEEELDDLQALQQSFALDDEFGATDSNGVKTPRAIELESEIKKTADKIRPLRAQRDQIQAKYADRAAKRKASKEAKEAAKLAGVAVPA